MRDLELKFDKVTDNRECKLLPSTADFSLNLLATVVMCPANPLMNLM